MTTAFGLVTPLLGSAIFCFQIIFKILSTGKKRKKKKKRETPHHLKRHCKI